MLAGLKVSFRHVSVYFTDQNIELNFEGLEMQK